MGRGFSPENLRLMRAFYIQRASTISQTLSGKSVRPPRGLRRRRVTPAFSLSWSHHVCLLDVDDSQKRIFYEEEATRSGWSVTT